MGQESQGEETEKLLNTFFSFLGLKNDIEIKDTKGKMATGEIYLAKFLGDIQPEEVTEEKAFILEGSLKQINSQTLLNENLAAHNIYIFLQGVIELFKENKGMEFILFLRNLKILLTFP